MLSWIQGGSSQSLASETTQKASCEFAFVMHLLFFFAWFLRNAVPYCQTNASSVGHGDEEGKQVLLFYQQFCFSLLICQCEVKRGVKKPRSSSSSSGDDERKQVLLFYQQFCLSLLICQCEVKRGVKKPRSSSSSGDDERKQVLLFYQQFCLSLLICQCEVKHGVKKPKSSSSSSDASSDSSSSSSSSSSTDEEPIEQIPSLCDSLQCEIIWLLTNPG